MNKVRKDKVTKVAANILNDKDIKTAMLNAGYSEVTANQGMRNKVVQEALAQISTEATKQGMTTEQIIKLKIDHLRDCQHEYLSTNDKQMRIKWSNQVNTVSDSILKYTTGEKLQINQDFKPPPVFYNPSGVNRIENVS